MDLEDAFNVDVGDKLIFKPSDDVGLILSSDLVPGQFETFYPEQPLIVSSITGFKELKPTKSKKEKLKELDSVFYPGKENYTLNKFKKDVDILYFEFEQVTTKLPMQLFKYPVYEKFSNMSLKELVEFMENGDFNVNDYMDALVQKNLYKINLKDYVSLMYLAENLAEPLTRDEVQSQQNFTMARFEEELKIGKIDEEDFERAKDIDLEQIYILQLRANQDLQKFYRKTGEFCEYILKNNTEVKQYADLVEIITNGKIKPQLMHFFYDEGFLLKKELLTFAMIGYPYIKNKVIKKQN